MNVNQVNMTVNNVSQDITKQGGLENGTEQFPKQYKVIAIKLDIATKASKLPNPNVSVHPKAIARMAEDQAFYEKVMSKINSFTSNPNISFNYPHITYSLVVDEDGEWVETMVDEDMKKLCEDAAERKDGNASIFDMLETKSPLLTQTQYNPKIETIYDYSNVLVEHKKRIQR